MDSNDSKLEDLAGCVCGLISLIAITSSVACGLTFGAAVGFGILSLWLVAVLGVVLASYKKAGGKILPERRGDDERE